jgi:hypothetical protein
MKVMAVPSWPPSSEYTPALIRPVSISEPQRRVHAFAQAYKINGPLQQRSQCQCLLEDLGPNEGMQGRGFGHVHGTTQ